MLGGFTTDKHGFTRMTTAFLIGVHPCSSVVNSRCLEIAMLHLCRLAYGVGLGLEGSPLGKKGGRLSGRPISLAVFLRKLQADR